MENSQNLLKALFEFNKTCPPLKKDGTNTYHHNRYAKLETIQNHIKPYLQEQKLVIIQSNHFEDNQHLVRTTLCHIESSESITSEFPLIVKSNTPQEFGSAVSYAKRYSISGLLNLIIEDEDDDGTETSKQKKVAKNNIVLPQSRPVAGVPSAGTAGTSPPVAGEPLAKAWLNAGTPEYEKVCKALTEGYTIQQVKAKYSVSKKTELALSEYLENFNLEQAKNKAETMLKNSKESVGSGAVKTQELFNKEEE